MAPEPRRGAANPTRRGRAARLVPLLALALTGCATLAPKDDYADYRQVRLAASPAERAVARARYLARHPAGQWADEVRRAHEADEQRLFEAGRDDPEVLRAYLRAYPEGRLVEDARDRLAALRTLEEQRARQRARIEAERRKLVEQRRRWARRALGFWLKTLGAIDRWGAPLPEVVRANPDFDRAFGRRPRPRCVRTECVKFYRLQFAVPVPGGTQLRRQLDVVLRLRVDGGRLVGADLLLPGRGLSRWYELEHREPIDDLDEERRGEALTWALGVLEQQIRAAWPQARPVDVVPEPLPPLAVPLPTDAEEGSAELPDEPAGDQPSAGEGVDLAQPPSEQNAASPDEAPASLSLPVALGAWRTPTVTVVAFAAAPDESGPAFDGIHVRWSGWHDASGETAPAPAPDEEAGGGQSAAQTTP